MDRFFALIDEKHLIKKQASQLGIIAPPMHLRLVILFASMAGLLAIEAVNSSVLAQKTSPKKKYIEN